MQASNTAKTFPENEKKDTESKMKTRRKPKYDFIAVCNGVKYRFTSETDEDNEDVTRYIFYNQCKVCLCVYQKYENESKGVFECSSELSVEFKWDPETLEPINESMKITSNGKKYSIDEEKIKPIIDKYTNERKKKIEKGDVCDTPYFKMIIPGGPVFNSEGERMDQKMKKPFSTFICEFDGNSPRAYEYDYYLCPGDMNQSEVDKLIYEFNICPKIKYEVYPGGDLKIKYGEYKSVKNCYFSGKDFCDYMLYFDD